ncbi:MAG: hypothetical protein RBT76_11750 [candidate division Zixibacteria bacterium]|nr:hypothetical protein [candidate division Zixibacteria bacterium]
MQLHPVTVYDGYAMVTNALSWNDSTNLAVCLNARTGALLWADTITAEAYSLGQAAAGYGLWYVQVANHAGSWVAAYDIETGNLAWVDPVRTQGRWPVGPTLYKDRLVYLSGLTEAAKLLML